MSDPKTCGTCAHIPVRPQPGYLYRYCPELGAKGEGLVVSTSPACSDWTPRPAESAPSPAAPEAPDPAQAERLWNATHDYIGDPPAPPSPVETGAAEDSLRREAKRLIRFWSSVADLFDTEERTTADEHLRIRAKATALQLRTCATALRLAVTGGAKPAPSAPPSGATPLEQLRSAGWSVAVHNDYTLNGEHRTFWGFSRGREWIRGEGRTDAEALARALAEAGPAPSVATPQVPVFDDARRAWVNTKTLRGGELPLPELRTPEALAQHVEAMVCSFLGWPGTTCSDAELVYTTALGALRRMQELAGSAPSGATDGDGAWLDERAKRIRTALFFGMPDDAQTQILADFDAVLSLARRGAGATNDPAVALAERALDFGVRTFGPGAGDRLERATRLAEEAIELLQAEGGLEALAAALVARTYSRPAGQPAKEIAQVGVTALAYCAVARVDLLAVSAAELDRIEALPPEHWRKRHAAKAEVGITFTTPAPAAAPTPNRSTEEDA